MDVANATTGLTLALRARGLRGARVGLPAGVCMQVPLAVRWSGNTPVWLDIDPVTLGLSVQTLDAAGSLDAVVFTHAYGARGHLDAVVRWCREHGVFLIDDRAPADPRVSGDLKVPGHVDAHHRSRGPSGPRDVVADVTLVSYGRGKLVDLGRGGRVFARDEALGREIARLVAALPPQTAADAAALDALMARHTQLYNNHYFADRDALAEFGELAVPLERAFVHAMDPAWPAEAAPAEAALDAAIRRRAGRADRYAERFAEARQAGRVRLWEPGTALTWWRFILFVPADRQRRVLRRLLAEGVPVSTWFPPADLFFTSRQASGLRTPVADAIGDTIVNLWVTDEADVDRAADLVLAELG